MKSVLKKFHGHHHELEDPSSPWKLICSTCPSFPFLFRQPWTWLYISNSVGVSRKAEDDYLTGAPGPCSQILVESELHIFFCYFVCIFYVLCCVSGLCSWVIFFWFPLESWFSWLILGAKLHFWNGVRFRCVNHSA